MRYKDFNLTEEQLDEVKMSTANLTKLSKNIDARAGIEFEMYVPDVNSGDDEELDPEPDYDQDESFPTGPGWHRDVINFFRGGDNPNGTGYIQRQIDNLNENFWGWMDDELENYMSSEQGQERASEIGTAAVDRDDYESDEEWEAAIRNYMDENEDEIKNQIEEEFREDADSHFERYLEEERIDSMSDFANEYGLDWPYWNYPERDRSGSVDVDDVAQDFSDAVGMPVKASTRYHGVTRDNQSWIIEPDGSLDSPDSSSDSGLEFVSPPMPLDQMIEKFDAVMKWASRVGAYTNTTTGLHMNVSIPNYDRNKIDFIKLALFLGDEYVANQFNRLGTFYAKNTTDYIRGKKNVNPQAVEELFNQMRSGMNTMASRMVMAPSTDKYMSIHAKNGWIEFRSPGGDYIGEYAANRDKIVNTLLRMVVAMNIAMDPEAEKEEYARKLNRLFKPTRVVGGRGERQRIEEPLTGNEEDTIKFFSQYSAGVLPRSALKSFIKRAQTQREVKKQKPDDGKQYWWNVAVGGQRMEVVASSKEEAWKKALDERNEWWRYNIDQADIKALRPYEEPRTPSRDQEFTGTWEVVTRLGNEVVYTFSGIGNEVAVAQRRAENWAEATGFDDPIYVRPVMRPRGSETPAVGGEQSSDANYEIIDRSRTPSQPVFRMIANTDDEASRKFMDWLRGNGIDPNNIDSWRGRYGWRRIEGRPTSTPVPGSTQDRINQRLAAQEPESRSILWRVYINGQENDPAARALINAPTEYAARQQAIMELPNMFSFVPFSQVIAIPHTPEPEQAQGTESLPAGNTRWLVLDQNDREVYSFVHRSNQGEANQYAANWLRQNGLLGQGEYMVVPAR